MKNYHLTNKAIEDLVDGEVEVIRILHERMDIYSKFGD